MQSSSNMAMAFELVPQEHLQHQMPDSNVFESHSQHDYRLAHNTQGHVRGMSVNTAQLREACAFRPSHHGHHLSLSAIQAPRPTGLDIPRPLSHSGVVSHYLDESCTPYEAYLEPGPSFLSARPSIMTMLESADSIDGVKPAQSMFTTPIAAPAVPAPTPTATSTGAPPVSPAATLAYPSNESIDTTPVLREGASDHTSAAAKDVNCRVPLFINQPVMMTVGSGLGSDVLRSGAETLRSSTSPSASSKANKREQKKKTTTAKVTSSSNSASATKQLFTARAMTIQDLKLDSCIDASIESTGITLDDIAAYVKEPDSKERKTDGGKRWTCIYPGCGKQFGRKENIKSHIQTHLGDRQFKCNHCKKCFVRGHDLKRHAKIHTGLKPYPCECGNSFARHDALTRHKQRGMCSGAIRSPAPRTVKRGRPRTKTSSPPSRPCMMQRLEKARLAEGRTQERHYAYSNVGGNVSHNNGYSSAGEMSSSASTVLSLSASPPATASLIRHDECENDQAIQIGADQERLSRDGVGLPPEVFTVTPPTSPGNVLHGARKVDHESGNALHSWLPPGDYTRLEHDVGAVLMSNQPPALQNDYLPSPIHAASPRPCALNMLQTTLLTRATSTAPDFNDDFANGVRIIANTFDAEVASATTSTFSSTATTSNAPSDPTEFHCQPGLFLQHGFGNQADGSLFTEDRYSSFSDFDMPNVLLDDGMLVDTVPV